MLPGNKLSIISTHSYHQVTFLGLFLRSPKLCLTINCPSSLLITIIMQHFLDIFWDPKNNAWQLAVQDMSRVDGQLRGCSQMMSCTEGGWPKSDFSWRGGRKVDFSQISYICLIAWFAWAGLIRPRGLPDIRHAWFWSGSSLIDQAAAWFWSGMCLIDQAAAWFWSGSSLIDQATAWFWSCMCLIDQA